MLHPVAPRFDLDQRTLELSVADLLESRLFRTLGFSSRGGFERMWLGQAIHSQYQEAAIERDPGYRREVSLRHTFEHRGWRVTVQGRIDGLRREANGELVVEEIKSIRRGSIPSALTRELWERQAALYCWLLRETEAVEPRAELVVIEIGSEDVVRSEIDLHLDAVGAAVAKRLNELIGVARAQADARDRRRAAGESLAFPYGGFRKGQEEIVSAVENALEGSEHLLIEAPTGIGKTIAGLWPALRFALQNDRRVFVLTAKTLQQEMANRVLGLLNPDGAFRSLQLRAKSKMCANDQVLCHEEYCRFARDYAAKLEGSGLLQELPDRFPNLLPDAIRLAAKREEVCPFEVSLELVGKAQVTVCDYNYVFDPWVALSDFGGENDLSDTILIIDEIHNLVDRGRGYWSPSLSSVDCHRAGEKSGGSGFDPVHRAIRSVCRRLAGIVEEAAEDRRPGSVAEWALEDALPEEDLWRIRPEMDRIFVDYLEYRRETRTLSAEDPFVDLYFRLLKFLHVVTLLDSSFSTWVEGAGEDRRLRILCRDPGRQLGKILDRCHSAIGLSATLSPVEFYRDLLGFDAARTGDLRVPAPFPKENRRLVIDSSIATTYRERPLYVQRIGEQLGQMADAVPGNCLVLFPSYRFLADVHAHLESDSKRILVQQQTDGDAQREEILDTLRTAVLGDVLLLAVAGGVFAEGVDYPGDVLKAVAVVGPCLPPPTLELELLKDYYDERFERGFEYAFVVPGMTRVVQAVGRLIRSPEDTGLVVLMDQRFTRRPYRHHLPPDWIPDEGVRALVDDPSRAARAFFELGPGRR